MAGNGESGPALRLAGDGTLPARKVRDARPSHTQVRDENDGCRPMRAAPLEALDPEAVRILDAIIDRLAFRVGGETLRFPSRDGGGGRTPLQMSAQPQRSAEPGGAGQSTDAPIAGSIHAAPAPLVAAVAAWADNLAALGKRPKTVSGYRKLVNAAIRENNWTDPSEVTEGAVAAWMDEKCGSGTWKGVTRNRNLAAMRSFTRFMRKRGLLAVDPLADADRAENDGGDGARAASAAEARTLVRFAWHREQSDKRASGTRWLYWACLFLTGARVSEPGNWRWKHLCLEAEVPHIHWTRDLQKNKRVQDTALCPQLVKALREHRERMRGAAAAGERRVDANDPEAYVFATVPPRCQFRADRERAGIRTIDDRGRRFSPHSARKAFSTWLRTAGVDGSLVNALMRHTVTVEGRYDDRPLSAQAVAVALLPQLIPVDGGDNGGGLDTDSVFPQSSHALDGPMDDASVCPSEADENDSRQQLHAAPAPRPPSASLSDGPRRRGSVHLEQPSAVPDVPPELLSALIEPITPIAGSVTVDRRFLAALLGLAARLLAEPGRVHQGQSERSA
jgi:integrase